MLQSDYELYRKKHFSNLCVTALKKYYPQSDLLLTHSATGALEMAATLSGLSAGDEVIMPSFTFVSTANAFVSRGAVPVFVDIKANDLNLDENLVEQAITPKTKAIVAVHYAGHACDLKALKTICEKNNLLLIEDAAMGFGAVYEGKALGSYGDFGVVSFDITKHVSAIQGGVLLVNNAKFSTRAQTIYHIGTNRSDFEQGKTSAYEWVDVGSKYQMNELNSAFLYDQLQQVDSLILQHKKISLKYFELLKPLQDSQQLKLMPEHTISENIHEFYILLNSEIERENLKRHLQYNGVEAFSHYQPLHVSVMGRNVGKNGGCLNTEMISKMILRLPMHREMNDEAVEVIVSKIFNYFKK